MERNTKQKDAVLEALRHTGEFMSAAQLHERLGEQGTSIGLATVYRQLNALEDAGLVDTVRMDGVQLFRLCGSTHHHHLVCTGCGKTVEIDPPSETWLKRVADQHGFTVQSHTLEVFGLCLECRRGAARGTGDCEPEGRNG